MDLEVSDLNLSYGVTSEMYGLIEPKLSRPLTLGPMRRHESTPPPAARGMSLDVMGANGPRFGKAPSTWL